MARALLAHASRVMTLAVIVKSMGCATLSLQDDLLLDLPDDETERAPVAEMAKLRHDQHITTLQCIETGSEARSLGTPAIPAIVEYPFAARGCQSFDTEIEDLPNVAWRSLRVANYRHVLPSLGII